MPDATLDLLAPPNAGNLVPTVVTLGELPGRVLTQVGPEGLVA